MSDTDREIRLYVIASTVDMCGQGGVDVTQWLGSGEWGMGGEPLEPLPGRRNCGWDVRMAHL